VYPCDITRFELANQRTFHPANKANVLLFAHEPRYGADKERAFLFFERKRRQIACTSPRGK
jgi:hypothetical protein